VLRHSEACRHESSRRRQQTPHFREAGGHGGRTVRSRHLEGKVRGDFRGFLPDAAPRLGHRQSADGEGTWISEPFGKLRQCSLQVPVVIRLDPTLTGTSQRRHRFRCWGPRLQLRCHKLCSGGTVAHRSVRSHDFVRWEVLSLSSNIRRHQGHRLPPSAITEAVRGLLASAFGDLASRIPCTAGLLFRPHPP
jgi:hypothetical protein